MKPIITMAAVLLSGALSTAQAAEIDLQAGKRLLEKHCTACHGSEVYTRKDRKIQSRSSLSTQVQRCQLAQNLQWFDESVENVAEYLNTRFYHFNK